MKLPEAFLNRMEALLGDELEAFLNSYEDPRFYGLRVNTLKISVEDFLKISPFKLEPIPWTRDGFYYDPEDKPTRHPHYFAGLYYIQEPSAMAPVNVLEPNEMDNVLDMCACPGGKSVQIASYLHNKGLLVSNDISTSRIKALVKNLEMMGVTNVLILNTTEEVIGERFEGFFDKLLIDAPCSGEGMFRKEPKMVAEWDEDYTKQFRTMQDSILENIHGTLKPEGELVYSTCTFSALENEDCLNGFLARHEDYRQETLKADPFEFATKEGYGRLWPHRLKGEGHFVARLKRVGEGQGEGQEQEHGEGQGKTFNFKLLTENSAPEYFKAFMLENLVKPLEGRFEELNGKLYLRPLYDLPLKGVRVVRYGWLLGEWDGKKFSPSQAMVMGLKATDLKRVVNFSADQIEAIKYLKGETLHADGADGLTMVTVDGYPLGWAKMNKGTLKNMYQSAWRLV